MINSRVIEELFDYVEIVDKISLQDLKTLINCFNNLEDYSTVERVIINVRRLGKPEPYSDEDVRAVVDLSKRIFSLASKNKISRADVAKEICVSYFQLKSAIAIMSDSNGYKQLLDKLILIGNVSKKLGVIAKAYDIYEELPRKFNRSRILTDIRPVFGETEETMNKIVDSVVIHTLVLSFIESDELKEFHLNLDSRGLDALESAIMRARVKEQDAGKILGVIGINIIKN